MSHYINTLVAEEKQHRTELRQEENRILGIANEKRKQELWNNLHRTTDLAINGLTEEQLNEIENNVY